jgi:hypothetical protein
MAANELRFGLGRWDGLRSSSWKVSVGNDSSVYVQSRDVGRAMKVSLHPPDPLRPGSEWRLAWTSEYAREPGLPDGHEERLLDAWGGESRRLDGTPLKHAFAVVLGRFSMGLNPLPEDAAERAAYERRLAKVAWIDDCPDLGHAWQFNVLVGDPGYNFVGPPGARAMRALGVGKLTTPNGADVWVTRNLIPFDEAWRENIVRAANATVETFGPRETPGVYRAHMIGRNDDGLRFFAEVAVSMGARDEDLVP